MDQNTPEALFQALRESGTLSEDGLAELDRIPSTVVNDPIALADHLRSKKILNGYQAKKVRINRIIELLVGQYLVIDKIGEGGMGKVYKAVDVRMHRLVALKLVRPHLMANKVVRMRYEREARAAAQLNHPNIVSLYNADEAGGRYYLAMEFVNGSDLARLVKEFGQLHFSEAAEYCRQAALGLQHAHDMNLVHRDIKPSNLLVTGERAIPGTGGVAEVKILDMGLVRCVSDDDDPTRTELTRDGTVVGTPDYMSPEQAKNSSTVDGRADLYSLGGTLYYLLSGRPPFPDGTPIDKLLRHQLDEPPDIRKFRPDCPKELAEIVHRLLAKKPEERFVRAADVAAMLAPLCDGDGAMLTDSSPSVDPPVPEGDTLVTAAVNAAEDGTKPKPAKPRRRTAVVVRPNVVTPTTPLGIPKPKIVSNSSGSIPGYEVEPSEAEFESKRRKKKTIQDYLPHIMIATGVGMLALLTVVFVLMNRYGTDAKAITPNKDATPKTVTPPETAPPPAPPTPQGLCPPSWNVPEAAAAVMVIHPNAYWQAVNSGGFIRPDSTLARTIRNLSSQYRFDMELADRITIAFPPSSNKDPNGTAVIAIKEGKFLTPEWIQKAYEGTGSNPASPDRVMTLATKGGSPAFGMITGNSKTRMTYAIGSDRAALTRWNRQITANKEPAGVARGILESLPNPFDPNVPLLTFAAGDFWVVPGTKGQQLQNFSVRMMQVRTRLVGQQLTTELLIFGDTRDSVVNFYSKILNFDLAKQFEPVKLFMQGFSDPEFDTVGQWVRLRTVVRWNLTDAHDWFERFLTPE